MVSALLGYGGSGKTTLASSLYMKISCHFQGHCIVESVREKSSKHGLETMQEKIISSLLKTKMELLSVEEGKHIIRSRLSRSNVLIILDDVSDRKQLDALAGSHRWFGNGSRIIITTRDEHLLRTHKVDHVCPVTLLSHDEAISLFNKHAYNKNSPINDYDKLSLHVVSYANGLPLALKVLGSFLYDKDEKEWMSSLARLKDIPQIEIVEKLKISYDGLNIVEKELFLDIACFFRGKSIEFTYHGSDEAMEVFEACGYHPDIGIKVLRQKALITIVNGKFDMHDLVQEMGHYIVRGEHPNNPEKHSRVWKDDEIRNMCHGDATMGNVIKNHYMLLKLEGHEIAKEFRPPLASGSIFKLKLPENWSNDFSGFLMCAVGTYEISYYSQRICMEHVSSCMEYKDDMVWEESDNDKRTLIWYVSFASLKHTSWWNSTYKAVLFSLGLEADIQSFSGFGVALVARKSGSGPTETSTTQQEYECSHYTPNFNIVQDLQYALKIEFPSKYEAGNV
ncbi:disease resistance protein RUN1-like [Helianthus annuus]|uniref:disease resistance protein RUN1-like n=1 Tax=Helianthus annuus TaxID=4232 RepID=UPI000B9080C4|nr:disease resistance protein RUN1-like [Helianthus annuus]